jgi:hypothetical protein
VAKVPGPIGIWSNKGLTTMADFPRAQLRQLGPQTMLGIPFRSRPLWLAAHRGGVLRPAYEKNPPGVGSIREDLWMKELYPEKYIKVV